MPILQQTAALLSCTDKAGLVELATFLQRHGLHILATDGTAAHLEGAGIACQRVADYTGFPEILGGRVKTLHPKLFAGILGAGNDRDILAAQGILPIAVVAVDLYPFARLWAEQPEVLPWEGIDIGGVALLRAAAKNCAHVAAVVGVSDHHELMEAMSHGETMLARCRRTLARRAFARTAAYDNIIASALAATGPSTSSAEEDSLDWPEHIVLTLAEAAAPRYGENPHQKAACYRMAGQDPLFDLDGQVPARLSYNNLMDAQSAWACVTDLQGPACVVVKHLNPCGAGLGATLAEAAEQAWNADPLSAYGGIVALNEPCDVLTAKRLCPHFMEVLVAPDFTTEAQDILEQNKPRLRLLRARQNPEQRQWRSAWGLIYGQDDDHQALEPWTMVTGILEDESMRTDLFLAAVVAKHARSNAVILAKGGRTIGVGCGQTSRVDAVSSALFKATDRGHDPAGAVAVSDGFFPFRDGLDKLAQAGIRAVLAPNGSKRDPEVLQAAQEAGVMLGWLPGRHFRH